MDFRLGYPNASADRDEAEEPRCVEPLAGDVVFVYTNWVPFSPHDWQTHIFPLIGTAGWLNSRLHTHIHV